MDLDATIGDLVARIMEMSQVSPEHIQIYRIGYKGIFSGGTFTLKNMREYNKDPKIFENNSIDPVFFISF